MLFAILKKKGACKRKMQLPKVAKQIGKVTGNNRIYIEDYAYTYLNELKSKQMNFPVRVALYGHAFRKEEKQFYLIYGASGVLEEMERGHRQEWIEQEYFKDCSLIGHMNLYSGTELPGEREGCFIFYDKNEAMQNYLISCYQYQKQKAETKSSEESLQKEKVFLAAGRSTEGGSSFFRYLAEKLLFVVLIVMAAASVTIINRYQQMHDFMIMAAKAVQIIE